MFRGYNLIPKLGLLLVLIPPAVSHSETEPSDSSVLQSTIPIEPNDYSEEPEYKDIADGVLTIVDSLLVDHLAGGKE